MKKIVEANGLIKPDNLDYKHYYIKFTGVSVGKPKCIDDRPIFPNECRIRDMTYSAPIYCSVEYTVGSRVLTLHNVHIGNMPIMLGSSNCWLSGMSHEDLAIKKECPYDPRGYFIIKGSEKVVLIQEQISKNRIIIEEDPQKNLSAQVTSTSLTQKTRTTIVYKNKKFYLKQNAFSEDIPVGLIFRAMGMETDQELAQLVGTQSKYLEKLALSIQEVS